MFWNVLGYFGKLLGCFGSFFYHGPALVGPWSCGRPFRTSLTHFIEQKRTNTCQPWDILGQFVMFWDVL